MGNFMNLLAREKLKLSDDYPDRYNKCSLKIYDTKVNTENYYVLCL